MPIKFAKMLILNLLDNIHKQILGNLNLISFILRFLPSLQKKDYLIEKQKIDMIIFPKNFMIRAQKLF